MDNQTRTQSDQSSEHPYGLAHLNLHKILHRQRKYTEAMFAIYLSARSNIPDWTFSAADIIKTMEIKPKVVYKLCKLAVKAGIFSELEGNSIFNLKKHTFDVEKLTRYLQGTQSLSEFSVNPKNLIKFAYKSRKRSNKTIVNKGDLESVVSPRHNSCVTTTQVVRSSGHTRSNIEKEKEKEDTRKVANAPFLASCLTHTDAGASLIKSPVESGTNLCSSLRSSRVGSTVNLEDTKSVMSEASKFFQN